MKSVEERVAAGMALIVDRIAEIDLDRLDMSSSADCILGQLYPSFTSGLVALGLYGDGIPEAEYGFECYREDIPTGYPELTAEWNRQLYMAIHHEDGTPA